MYLGYVFVMLSVFYQFKTSFSYEGGAACQMQHTLKPSFHKHGPPQIPQPPYELKLVDEKNEQVTQYKPKTKYYLQIIGTVPIRGFLLQPRLATKDGFIIGHLRGGEFQQEPSWEDYGIQFQSCPPLFNNSITNTHTNERYLIRVAWRAARNLGPIQFYGTIWEDNETYWSEWQPKSGFIFPADSNPLELNKPVPNTIVDQKPPVDVVVEDNDNQPSPPPLVFPSKERSDIDTNDVDVETESHVTDNDGFAHERISLKTIQSAIEDSFELEPLSANKIVVFGDKKEDDLVLHPDPLEHEPHTDIRHFETSTLKPITTTPLPRFDPCNSLPCFNGGICYVGDLSDSEWTEGEVDKFFCICEQGYTGLYCEVQDYCAQNKCLHGDCRNVNNTYECFCDPGFAGKNCDKQCPSYLCKNDGICIINEINQYLCQCTPGYGGETCEYEIDECASNPCKNGATCIDKLDSFQCECADGWMGDRCHRPCQNIYKSCKTWKKQRQCDLMRPRTNFFDLNCAVSCETCEYVNDTVTTDTPIPPLLEPLIFLLGEWHTSTDRNLRFPIDFSANSSGYDETISFSVTDVPMFGTPSINFTSIAVNKDDASDIQQSNGFLTIRPRPRDRLRVALTTVGNDAVTVVEEGSLVDDSMALTPVYKIFIDGTRTELHNTMERKFAMSSGFLAESITKYDASGRSSGSITKYFSRKRLLHYY